MILERFAISTAAMAACFCAQLPKTEEKPRTPEPPETVAMIAGDYIGGPWY